MTEISAKAPIQVKNNIMILRSMAYISKELTKIQCGWIPGIALWELKLYLARCQWENACIAQELRKRLQDFPGGKPDGDVSPNLVTLLEVMAAAPEGPHFIQGLFGALKPYLTRMYLKQLEETDEIVDSPSKDILEKALQQEERHISKAMELYATWNLPNDVKQSAEKWKAYIADLLSNYGEFDFDCCKSPASLRPYEPFRPSPIGLRDDRFETSYWELAPTEHLQDEGDIYEVKVIMNYFKEMQATETVATCLYEIKGMPWEFYYETSRHCWDEARHCMMGQRRFEQLGFDITKIKSMSANYAVRQLLDPLYRYAYITMVEEAGSMKAKRERVHRLEKYGKTLTARLAEYDLVDERNHVNNGFRWIKEILIMRKDPRNIEEVVEEAQKMREQAFELIYLDQDY